MIPLALIAIGLSALALAHETSRSRFAKHTQAVRGAFAAHEEADAQLAACVHAPDVSTAVQCAHAAGVANKAAAKQTASVAQTAQTEPERQVAAKSASVVLEREEKILSVLEQLGVGQCDVRSYNGVTPAIRDVLLAKLAQDGMAVTGNNPWDIDTNKHGVHLRAAWDPATQALHLIVTSGEGGYFGAVTCERIWERIDPVINEVLAS